MPLTNDEIAAHVKALTAALLADKIVQPEDQPVLNAVKGLATNLLQNINEIAATARGRQP